MTNVKVKSKASKITQEFHNAMEEAMDDTLVKALKVATPSKTGDTSANWDFESKGLGEFSIFNEPSGHIITYLVEGTKAHTIRPNTKKMLRFEIDDPPTFRDEKSKKAFNKKGVIFFFNKNKEAVFGYAREGNKYFAFAKKVNHPGTKARLSIEKVLDKNMKKFWTRVNQNLNK